MVSLESHNKKEKNVGNGKKKSIPREVYVIAQEVRIVKALACNDLKLREKQLRKLKKWIAIRSNSSFAFTEEDFLRLWKGLYYCMWMSDKPLVQENLAESLGQLIDCFTIIQNKTKFFGAFLKTMALEWFSIDQWRMDKFMMLIRRMLRYTFKALKKDNWSSDSIDNFNDAISGVLEGNVIGLTMHLSDIFLEELAKISDGEIEDKKVAAFAIPFVQFLAVQRDVKLINHVKKQFFNQLLWQSEMGRDFNEKFEAWKSMGFPTESIHNLEKVDEAELEDDNEELDIEDDAQVKTSNKLDRFDPRAGNVDVEMPILPVDTDPIVKYIESIMYKEITNTRSRKALREINNKYKKFKSGIFPLGVKTMPKIDLEPYAPLVKKKLRVLDELDKELFSATRQLKKLNKKKRKKLLAQINYDDINEENYDELLRKTLKKNKQIEVVSKKRKNPMNMNWIEEEIPEAPIKRRKEEEPDKKISKTPNLVTVDPITVTDEKDTKLKTNGDVNSKNDQLETFKSEWKKQMRDAAESYSVKKVSSAFLFNPYSKKSNADTPESGKLVLLGKSSKKVKSASVTTTPINSTKKKVKIVLNRNVSQKPSEYIRQVKNSPQLPFDSQKKPKKSLLKPNLMPSPINPFYKKKIGLQLNDTF